MRTTVTIADDAAEVAREFADQHEVTLGTAISMLIRQAHARSLEGIKYPAGFEPFPYDPDAPLVTTELVKRLQDELP
jgi:hypothetical protein